MQERPVRVRPAEVLDGVQQLDQRGAGGTGDDADRDDQRPEAKTVARDDPLAGDVRLR
jgi:hypothetical protein